MILLCKLKTAPIFPDNQSPIPLNGTQRCRLVVTPWRVDNLEHTPNLRQTRAHVVWVVPAIFSACLLW